MALTLYRIVSSNPPTILDFLSNQAKGRRMPDHAPETVGLWDGLSTYATADRRGARHYAFPNWAGILRRCMAKTGLP